MLLYLDKSNTEFIMNPKNSAARQRSYILWSILIAGVLAIVLLATPQAYAQQSCTQVKMIFGEADNTLYLIDGSGNRLRDIRNGNNLSNRQINSFIVLWQTPSKIGIEVADTGQTLYRYKNNVKQSGDRGYEDYIDNDFNDAVILITSVDCPEGLTRPRQLAPTPISTTAPRASQRSITPSVSSVSADNITTTTARAVVGIANHDGTRLTVRLRYQEKAETQDWRNADKDTARSKTSPATRKLEDLTPGVEYVLQASFDPTFPADGTREHSFTTKDLPSISDLSFENIQQKSATVVVNIADAGTDMKKVYLKHSIQGDDEWSMLPRPTVTDGDDTSIHINGLRWGTTYNVAVALSDDFSGMMMKSFTTMAAPSLSELSVGSRTQTTAAVTARIANPGTSQKTVKLHLREFGESEWGEASSESTRGSGVTFNLTGLEPATSYEVQAYLGTDPDAPQYVSFATLTPDPSISGISIGSITQTTAEATVRIAHPGGAQNAVQLRVREYGGSDWTEKEPKTTGGASISFDLSGLTPKTKYEVEASLSSDFSPAMSVTFTTLALDTVVSAISVDDIRQTTATANIEIANADGEDQTVHLRYRTASPQGKWSEIQKTTSSAATASIALSGLTADTEYEVQASLKDTFPEARTKDAAFTTLRYPSISEVGFSSVQKNSVTAVVTIADPDGTSQTVHLRYRTTTPRGDWVEVQETASSTAQATMGIAGLTADTGYEVEVSLSSDFKVVVSGLFTTLPLDPVVSKVSVDNITQTTANASIDIANANGKVQTVHMRYRTVTSSSAWSDVQTTTSDTESAGIELSGLTPGAEYEVQASLEDSFPAARTKHDRFTTLRHPGIDSFEVGNIGRNGATVSATIVDSHGVAQTVYVRHRQARYPSWKPTQAIDSVGDVASLRLRGLKSGTQHVAEASLDSSFRSDLTWSVTFDTNDRKDRKDDDNRSGGSSNVAPASPASLVSRAVSASLPGFSPMMLRFVAIEGGDSPQPQTFSVWNRSYGTMDFILSNHEEWLSLQPMSGMSGGPEDKAIITASVDTSGLASGQYADIIKIDFSSSGKSPGEVIVVLDVLPPDYVRQSVSRNEGGTVVLPDGAVKIVVAPLAPPMDVDVELMKVSVDALGQPPGERQRVVAAIDSNTYLPGADTPSDHAYSPYAELWVMLPSGEADACEEGRVRLHSLRSGAWSLVEHRCSTDDSGNVWAVSQIERLGAFVLTVSDELPPTPVPTVSASAGTDATRTKITRVVIPARTAEQRTVLPAQAPTPLPIRIAAPPTPTPDEEPSAAPAVAAPVFEPTPTATPAPVPSQKSSPPLQASDDSPVSGEFNRTLLAAVSIPLIAGAVIVRLLYRREKPRRR